MLVGSILLFVGFLALSLGQYLLVLGFLRRFRRWQAPEVSDQELPHAAIVMSLRGSDPFLDECLDRLARQDYPDFEIRLVIDCPADPAREQVDRWLAAHPSLPVRVQYLRDPFETCTLYCSSLYRAVEELDESIEVVAFVNADTMTHPAWLRSLVTPLMDEGVGAVTGNRWYLPGEGRMGSWVRTVQNVSAVVAMYFMDLIWGGSLALKRAIFAHPAFLEQLKVSSCEDHAVHKTLKATGLRLAYTPAVMMVNREECSLGVAFRFMRRQMVWTRMYHPGWPSLLGHALITLAVVLVSAALFWTAVFTGQWLAAGLNLGGVLIYFAENLVAVFMLNRTIVQRIGRDQGQDPGKFPRGAVRKLLAALPLTLFVHLAAVFSAARLRRVDWRGVSYDLLPPGRVRLVEYRPYQPPSAATVTERMSI